MGKIVYILSLSLLFCSCKTDNQEKLFLIENVDKFIKLSNGSFIIKNLEGYHDEKTLTLHVDSSYTIVCWGKRESIWWGFRKDKVITVSIPYNRSKGENVDLDVKLFEKFKNKKILF